MVHRAFWEKHIESLLRERSILWLYGVRRAGKTTLLQGLPDIEYFDCELPGTRRILADPEAFLTSVRGKRVVLDEIHRLPNPAELLKIAADHEPSVRIVATGSSLLGASSRFRDTLLGRKHELWLTPMMSSDLEDFGGDLPHRLLQGGLPPFFLTRSIPEREFQEWVDAYWAKDILELFRLERRASFQRFLELLLAQSSGMFEATRFAAPCEVSRTTIANYLSVLAATNIVHVIRPLSTRRSAEIVAAPKVYGFDTGFVCYHRGWNALRSEDMGFLWEHYVLNELHAYLQTRDIRYWRDKHGHEVDFVLSRRGGPPVAIECKWRMEDDDTTVHRGLAAFLRAYPHAEAYIVAENVQRTLRRRIGGSTVTILSLPVLLTHLLQYTTAR